MLNHTELRTLYDRLGSKQDQQAFYEAAAFANLLSHVRLEEANHLFEFGCGTGSFASTLLNNYLSSDSLYVGMDQSATMVQLARRRLEPWGSRATVLLSGGPVTILAADGSIDRLFTNYVLDLLSEADIRLFMAEAHRVLRPDGLLCLISLTYGNTPFSRLVMWGWQHLYAINPARLGGCRPIQLFHFLEPDQWQLRHVQVITSWGLASEVIVAAPARAVEMSVVTKKEK